uniref:RING-type E3 ubiquitin transferase n=1 Tax=Emiliania huxleyi TaxID=2903 RepID=A0A7S3WLJ4_EMIHU
MHRGANIVALLWLCVGTALANVDPAEHEATLVVVLPASAQAYAPPQPTHGHPTHSQIHHTSPHAAAVAFALLWLCIVLLVRSCNHIQPLAAVSSHGPRPRPQVPIAMVQTHLENQDAEARKRARREWASEAASGLRQRSLEEGRCALASGSSLGFCCICMEEGSVEEPLTVLPCGHEFHACCIEQWLVFRGKAAGCPLCKAPLFPKEAKEAAASAAGATAAPAASSGGAVVLV